MAERGKKYRDKLKQHQCRYNQFKQKDRERKAKKLALMNESQKNKYHDNHRKAQERNRKKLKLKTINETQSK